MESSDLCRIATNLELSLSDRPAHLVVRQRPDDPASVCIELTRPDQLERTLERLAGLGYSDGPDPSRVVSLREGDLVRLTLRDNIQEIVYNRADDSTVPVEETKYEFLYNSNLSSSLGRQILVRERDVFAQNALDVYRGYVRLSLVERPYQPPPKLVGPSGFSAVYAAAAGIDSTTTTTTAATGQSVAGAKKTTQTTSGGPTGKRAPVVVDKNLLCEVMLTLPKPPKEFTRISRMGTSESYGSAFDRVLRTAVRKPRR
jgi:hypothetical protein